MRDRISLSEELSRTRQIRVEFELDIQNAGTYMTWGTKYSMKLSQGCMKNEDKYSEGTQEAMLDHNTTRK